LAATGAALCPIVWIARGAFRRQRRLLQFLRSVARVLRSVAQFLRSVAWVLRGVAPLLRSVAQFLRSFARVLRGAGHTHALPRMASTLSPISAGPR